MLRASATITSLVLLSLNLTACGDDATSPSDGSTSTGGADETGSSGPTTTITTTGTSIDTDTTTGADSGSSDETGSDTTDLPPPPEGERIVCENEIPAAPAGAVCGATPGGNTMLIRGTVLAGQTIYENGTVLVDASNPNGTILCAGCDCADEAPADAAVLDCPDGVISPGLVNPHDHITFSLSQPQGHGTERYDHRHEWRRGLNGATEINTFPGSNNSREGILYGELRMLFGAATSVSGSGSASGLIRNLDRADDTEGLVGVDVDYATFPLGDSDGTLLADGCGYPFIESENALNEPIYMPHIAEGINDEANNEFTCLSGAPGNDLMAGNTSVIHGIGMRPSDIAQMAEVGAKLVWSPRSNIDLYGITADVLAYHHQGVAIALGTDWSASGSMNVLRELQCAAQLNENHYDNAFSDYELWMMSTFWAADSQGAGTQIGLIAPGYIADLAIFDGSENADYRAIIDGSPNDVALVMRGGTPLFGDPGLIEGLVPAAEIDGCETFDMCGEDKQVCAQRDTGLTMTAIQAAVNSQSYDLFPCGEPSMEPSCDPFREMEFPARDGVMDSDGDGIADADDNCPLVFNPLRPMDADLQADEDQDGIGDACDLCPLSNAEDCEIPDPLDPDGDGVPSLDDNCPTDQNPDQEDADDDQVGDACDACPDTPNPGNGPCPASIYAIKDGTIAEGSAVLLEDKVVTAAAPGFGFFLQAHPDDADYVGVDYSGIFVFVGSDHGAVQGDRVTVSGTVQDFFGQLQLTASGSVTIESMGNELPAPEATTAADIVEGGIREEQLEAALVTISDLSVSDIAPTPGPGDAAPTNEFEVDDGLRVNDLFFLIDPFPTVDTTYPQLTGIARWANGFTKLEPRGIDDLPLTLSALGPDAFLEAGTTGQPLPTFSVQLTTAAAVDTTVDLSYLDAGVVTGPASVVVPAGDDSASIELTGVMSGTTTVTANLDGVEATAEVTVYSDADARIPTLAPSELSLSVNAMGEMTVSLNLPAPAGGQVVDLSATPGTFASVPATVTVPEDAFSATFMVTAEDTAGEETITAEIDGATSDATVSVSDTPAIGLVIAGVFYNPNGGDDGLEWVKLFNGSGGDVDLSGYSLAWGGTDYTYGSLQLAGTVANGECFLVGGPNGNADTGFVGAPMFDQAVAFSPNIQNSGGTADGVALFDVPAAMVGAATVPVDAVIYGDNNTNGLLDESGAAPMPDVGDAGSGNALVLYDDLTWGTTSDLAPLACLPLPAAP